MNHFKSLRLKNWLCYDDSIFKFHSGVNIIIGPTDHGKSAMMAALFKVINNRPMGDDFQSWWGGESLIALRLDDSIIKYRKDKQAQYQIKNVKTKKVITFTAFRSSVPQEVTDLLRLDRKINIQKQLEKKAPIFLLSESPGEVASHFNNVANLGNIDDSLLKGKQALAADNGKKKILDSQIKSKTKELQAYDALDDLKILIVHAEKLQSRIDAGNQLNIKLKALLREIEAIQDKINKIKKKRKWMPAVKEAGNLLTYIKDQQKNLSKLEAGTDEILKKQKRLKRINKKMEIKPIVNRALVLFQIIDEYGQKMRPLERQLKNINRVQIEMKKVQVLVQLKRKVYKKEFPDICPFCLSVVVKEKL